MTRAEAKARRLELTAYHEAGHAVAAFYVRRAFRYVTIVPDEAERTDGHVQLYIRSVPDDFGVLTPRQRESFEADVIVFLAGGIAEKMAGGRRYHMGAARDYQAVGHIILSMVGEEKEASAYANLLYIRTQNLLRNPTNWYAVESLAAELLQKPTIKAREAKDVIRHAWLNVPAERWADFAKSSVR